jgi:hypothetical protein
MFGPGAFLDPAYFWTRHMSGTRCMFGPGAFLGPAYFWTWRVSGPGASSDLAHVWTWCIFGPGVCVDLAMMVQCDRCFETKNNDQPSCTIRIVSGVYGLNQQGPLPYGSGSTKCGMKNNPKTPAGPGSLLTTQGLMLN